CGVADKRNGGAVGVSDRQIVQVEMAGAIEIGNGASGDCAVGEGLAARERHLLFAEGRGRQCDITLEISPALSRDVDQLVSKRSETVSSRRRLPRRRCRVT